MRAKLKSGSLSVFRKAGNKQPIYMANGHGKGAIIPDLTQREFDAHKERLEILPEDPVEEPKKSGGKGK